MNGSEATQFAVAATNNSALISSDEIKSVEIRPDEMW